MDRTIKIIVGFSMLFSFIAACAQMDLGGEQQAKQTSVTNLVKSGRIALLYGKPDAALPYFHEAAEKDPAYVNDLKEGVWTYVGRAYYDSRNFPAAQTALMRALERNPNDFMARLYLGLTEIQLQKTPRPHLSLDNVLTLLLSGNAMDQVIDGVKERGVSFPLSLENENKLRNYGATDPLIQQIIQRPRISTGGPSINSVNNIER